MSRSSDSMNVGAPSGRPLWVDWRMAMRSLSVSPAARYRSQVTVFQRLFQGLISN
ncbi:MAG TPA: hypothetical protein VGL89_03920 [Candidatus Koribacter sp.]